MCEGVSSMLPHMNISFKLMCLFMWHVYWLARTKHWSLLVMFLCTPSERTGVMVKVVYKERGAFAHWRYNIKLLKPCLIIGLYMGRK